MKVVDYKIWEAESLSSCDLAEEYDAGAFPYEIYTVQVVYEGSDYLDGGERIEILWNPEVGSAGITWGADAQYFDAVTVEDAVEQFLGLGEYADVERPCSLCGRPTGFEAGQIEPQWVICSDCEGTPEAEAAGYTHT